MKRPRRWLQLMMPTDQPSETAAAPTTKPPRRPPWLREALGYLAFILAFTSARSSLADHYHVPTGSMIPSVAVGDRVVVDKVAYGLRMPFTGLPLVDWSAPARDDVVVLDSPEDGKTLLKRVVAVPGDRVEVRGGVIQLDGVPVPIERDGDAFVERLGAAPHGLRLTQGGGFDFGPVVLGADEFLVLGDNRGESHDGRAFGLVRRHAIFGRVRAVWMRDGTPCWKPL